MTEYSTLFEPFHMTRRIEHFLIWLKELKPSTKSESKNGFFWIWLKELKSFQYDSKNWNWLKALNTLFSNMTHRFFWVWLTGLNTFFFKWLIELNIFLQMTQRIEPSSQNDSKNWTFLKIISLQDLKLFLRLGRWIFFNLDQGIEAFFNNITQKWLTLFWTWLSELNLFSTWLTELNPFKKHDS